ncbi:hypothetical protein [Streptomyces inhibens]|uniref:hypothetical protein n=1 Tax=Streptomyces inhibens TaxID=2293571 RepID=UPI001EE6C17A|nr:hypothetical protein [Streptomyces inhibens]UKY51091.1 hypothetical protein KI385_21225 [Streptomyces inhibens]
MSINRDGFKADPDELRAGASDVLKCLNPAKGADFSALNEDFDGSGQGEKILADKFETFCDTWEVAYLVLGDHAGDMSDKLKSQADTYEQNESHTDEYMQYINQHKNGSGL